MKLIWLFSSAVVMQLKYQEVAADSSGLRFSPSGCGIQQSMYQERQALDRPGASRSG